MGKLKESHLRRVQAVRHYASHNKLFLIIATVLIALLICGIFVENEKPQTYHAADQEQTQVIEENTVEETAHWRFYWIDLGILLVGGGFCTVMIIRERKKARDTI
ncbi:MAG: hypothetical protein PUC41_05305 [Oscillospiraceae bacterium]|nr:hypothetical protein [Oscillospiraceae bacterium]